MQDDTGSLRRGERRLSRRGFVRGAALAGAGALAAACAPSAVPAAPAQPAAPVQPAAPAKAPAAAAPAAPTPLDYGIISPSATSWGAYIMEAKGFLAREGIKGEMTLTRTSANGMAALVAPDGLQIFANATDPVIRAVEQGVDVVMVGGCAEHPAYSVIAHPSISSMADLAGKKVAVSGPKETSITFFRRLFIHYGVPLDSIEFISVGTTPERYAAIKAGAAQATILSQPNDFQAYSEGFHPIAQIAEILPVYQFTAWVVTRNWARGHEDLLVRFLRAHADALRWVNDPANKEEAITILSEGAKFEERFARQTYDLYMGEMKGRVLPQDGTLSLPGLQAVLDVMADLGEFEGQRLPSPEKYVDQSYLQKALQG
ncbi:MAG TPA: ABC transporter substrate-binding protein [Chloroflexota bacterium]|jgi:ABC-type nitrate/sulfonate/bicarbonate transport system substrate-binding protein